MPLCFICRHLISFGGPELPYSRILQMAALNILRQINRSAAALTAVALGVVVMVLASGFIDWNLRFGRENTIHSQLGHVQIMKAGFLEKGRSDPYAYILPADEASRKDVLAMSDVRALAPRLLLSGLVSAGETTLSFIGEGVDPAAEADLSSGLRFAEGRNLAPGGAQEVVVGAGLAKNLDIHLGQTLVLIVNTRSGGVGAVEARVVGIFESIAKAYDDMALRIPIQLARQLMRTDGEHLRLVLLSQTEGTDAVAAQLRERFPVQKYGVVPWFELADFYNKTAELFKKQVGVIYFIISVIIVLAISNTMTMSVVQRVGEIGTVMAVGNRRRDVLALFVSEGVVLGLCGTLVGLVLGCLLAWLLSAIGIPMPPGPGMTWGYVAGILVTPANLINAALIAIATTVVASIYPAFRASRMNIVDALRALQ